ncbi:ParA family protein [Bacillus cereus]|nr:ParA family protein [Bacillus cereus]MEC3260909.1 ParA family protein [Bacillus cereus]
MLIGVISQDNTYKQLFSQEKIIESVFTINEWQQKFTVDVEVVFLDGKIVDFNDIANIRELYPNVRVYYQPNDIKNSTITKTIEMICKAYDVTILHEGLTNKQVAKEIMRGINRNGVQNKQIISFFGTHSSVGVSTTVFDVAHALSKKVHEKVLVLSLNAWDTSDYFYRYKGKYLNDLKVDLQTKSLTKSGLENAVSKCKNFYHLAGNRDVRLQRFYNVAEIAYLLEIASETFDVVLIDGGVHFDNACSIQSLFTSSIRFLITTQEDKGYKYYFPQMYSQLLEPAGIKKDDFMLIINKHRNDMSIVSNKDIQDEVGMSVITTIPDMDILGQVATKQNELLYESADNSYQKPINIIANLIVSENGLNVKTNMEETKTKKGLLSFFGG